MKIAFFSAIGAMLLRLILFKNGHAPAPPGFMPVHLLVLVAVPFIVQYRLLREDPSSDFPRLFREGFRSAALYVLLFGFFIFGYYKWVDVETFPMKLNEWVDAAVKGGHSEAEARDRFGKFFSPFNFASISFFLLLMLGAANALITGMLHHKVLRKVQ